MLIANSKAKVTTGSKELDSLLSSYYSSYTNTKPYPAGSIFKNMLLEILLVAVAAAVIALVVMLLAKAFNKANVTYMQEMCIRDRDYRLSPQSRQTHHILYGLQGSSSYHNLL